MENPVSITLAKADWFQIQDALTIRCDIWTNTARHMRDEDVDPELGIADARNPEEADKIAAHYRDILQLIDQSLS